MVMVVAAVESAAAVIAVDDYIMCDVNICWLRPFRYAIYLHTNSIHPARIDYKEQMGVKFGTMTQTYVLWWIRCDKFLLLLLLCSYKPRLVQLYHLFLIIFLCRNKKTLRRCRVTSFTVIVYSKIRRLRKIEKGTESSRF